MVCQSSSYGNHDMPLTLNIHIWKYEYFKMSRVTFALILKNSLSIATFTLNRFIQQISKGTLLANSNHSQFSYAAIPTFIVQGAYPPPPFSPPSPNNITYSLKQNFLIFSDPLTWMAPLHIQNDFLQNKTILYAAMS